MSDLETFGKRLNFGCGFIAGAVVGIFGVLDWLTVPVLWAVIIVLVFASSCAVLAARQGDVFWHNFIKWM